MEYPSVTYLLNIVKPTSRIHKPIAAATMAIIITDTTEINLKFNNIDYILILPFIIPFKVI